MKESNTPVRSVPLLDLTRLDATLIAELEVIATRVLRSGHYILGPEVDAFEKACAEYVGVKHAIGVSSGTDALLLALMTLGVGAGDEVICPSFTFFATAGSVMRLGARPVFVDSSTVDFNALPEGIEAAMTKRTRAIMPVHLFGQSAAMDEILAIGKKHHVPVIEDAAQAIGAIDKGRQAGSMGTFGCFSFFPTKNLGAFGDAGLVTTNDDELGDKARILRVHGGKPKYYHSLVGANFRIDAMQAALLRPKLPRLAEATTKRVHNAKRYVELLTAAEVGAPNTSQGEATDAPILYPTRVRENHTYNQFTIRVRAGKRETLREHLSKRGVGTEIYYPVSLHEQPCFASLGHKQGAFPNAERLASEVMALPIFPELRDEELAYVVDGIRSFFRG
ncbi:MAG: DegT/DnrJ/EryC1/StrS family aminotransferase [Myxococcota bacterium]